jgi:pilus assembly protein CpaB
MLRVLVLVGALAAGIVAAWLSFGLQPETAPAVVVAAPEIKTQEVLVAAADLVQGAPLTTEQVRWQAWPEDAVNPGYILRSSRPEAIEELAGRLVRQATVVGEPIREAKLASRDAGYLAAILTPGMRAVAVRVSAESAAGGFILPNDHVDVLHSAGDGGRSRTILSNIRVLAIDQKAVDSETGADTALGKTATLELSPEQAEALAGAQAVGGLSLALRATADNKEVPAPGRRSASVTVRMVRSGQSQIIQTDGTVQ